MTVTVSCAIRGAARFWITMLTAVFVSCAARASDAYINPPAPVLTATSGPQKSISFTPYPSADVFRMLGSSNLGVWTQQTNGSFSNLNWRAAAGQDDAFHRLEVTPLSSNA